VPPWTVLHPSSTPSGKAAGYTSTDPEGDVMGFLKVNDQAGYAHRLEAVEGWRIMELIRLHGLPIEAACGGACACATCHVHVAPDWAGRVAAPREDEEAMLDTLPLVEPTSRLSCQLIWEEHLDGIEVTLAGA
jgi:2Fe-2S ferredoxin